MNSHVSDMTRDLAQHFPRRAQRRAARRVQLGCSLQYQSDIHHAVNLFRWGAQYCRMSTTSQKWTTQNCYHDSRLCFLTKLLTDHHHQKEDIRDQRANPDRTFMRVGIRVQEALATVSDFFCLCIVAGPSGSKLC